MQRVCRRDSGDAAGLKDRQRAQEQRVGKAEHGEVAPMPMASEQTATAVKPGFLRRILAA
jgi:hypothetical protein